MYAMICLGFGRHYYSTVFGRFIDEDADADYVDLLYYIVWDSEKKNLIRWNYFGLHPIYGGYGKQILITD